MKKLYTVLCLAFLSNAYKAQESLPYYHQYLLDGDFLFNPAQYGKTDYIQLNTNYQHQFSKFNHSPNVQSIGANANIFDRVGAGISVFRDSNGPISAGGITAGISYFIPLSSEGERKDQFSFGTSINFYNMNFDYSKINTEENRDPLLWGEKNNIFMVYANFGLAATYRGLFGGVSVNDIALRNEASIVNNYEPSPIKLFLNLGYNWNIADNIILAPSTLINLNTNSSRMIDWNLMATFSNDINAFSFGVSYRTEQSRFNNQYLSLSPIVKIRFHKFMMGATYNFGLSEIQKYGGNGFMFDLGYNFDNFINVRGFRY